MIPSKQNERFCTGAMILQFVFSGMCWYVGGLQQGLGLKALAYVSAVGGGLALLSMVHAMLMRLRDEEEQQSSKLADSASMFDGERAESHIRQRNLQQFEKYLIPSATVLLAFAELVIGVYLYRELAGNQLVPKADLIRTAAAVTIVSSAVLYLAGSFIAGLAYTGGQHVLRAVAGEMVGTAYLAAIAGIATLCQFADIGQMSDHVLTYFLASLMLVRMVEKTLTVIMEVYRPRRGGEMRLLHESRVNGLFAQPHGLIGSFTETLNYQFGITITETGVRRLLIYVIPGIIGFHLLVLLTFSCIVIINPGEQALLERFGHPHPTTPLLQPGFHWKRPWPIDRIYRRDVNRITRLDVGLAELAPEETIGMWSDLGAARLDQFLTSSGNAGTGRTSLGLMAAAMFVEYRIKDLSNYVYTTQDTDKLLKVIARREMVRQFGGNDLFDIMLSKRSALDSDLGAAIQQAADGRQLGIEIIAAGVRYMQPPPDLVEAFQSVVAGEEEKISEVLKAEAERNALITEKQTERAQIIGDAKSYRESRVKLATAGAENFQRLLPLYKKHSTMFRARAYFDLLDTLQDNRKIILATEVENQVINIDLKKSQSQLFDFTEENSQ